jgi:hypothetical protein
MTKLNIIDGGRDKSADPWNDAFMGIEPHIHDFRRMIELARLTVTRRARSAFTKGATRLRLSAGNGPSFGIG